VIRVTTCKPLEKGLSYEPHDDGDDSNAMYFIFDGRLIYSTKYFRRAGAPSSEMIQSISTFRTILLLFVRRSS
jgi:hypothetical protein